SLPISSVSDWINGNSFIKLNVESKMTKNDVGRIDGNVICQNFCHRLAPSTSAASERESGIAFKAPIKINILNAVPAQTVANRTTTKARLPLDDHGRGSPPNN